MIVFGCKVIWCLGRRAIASYVLGVPQAASTVPAATVSTRQDGAHRKGGRLCHRHVPATAAAQTTPSNNAPPDKTSVCCFIRARPCRVVHGPCASLIKPYMSYFLIYKITELAALTRSIAVHTSTDTLFTDRTDSHDGQHTSTDLYDAKIFLHSKFCYRISTSPWGHCMGHGPPQPAQPHKRHTASRDRMQRIPDRTG